MALERLPAVAEAFGEGRLSYDQVAPLARATTGRHRRRHRRRSTRVAAAHCAAFARPARPVTAAEAADAQARRSLRWHWDSSPACCPCGARLPEEAGAAVVAALENMTDAAKPDPDNGLFEPYEARAADALAELASSHLGALAQPDRATVVVVVDAEVLGGGDGVTEIEAGPALAAEAVRRQACDARAEVVAAAADGTTVGVGRPGARCRRGWPASCAAGTGDAGTRAANAGAGGTPAT